MDIGVFKEAQEAYARGDYRVALVGFTACTSDIAELSSAEIGKFYHLIGNCYIKSGEPSKAAEYYGKALELAGEQRRAPLLVNLGTACLSSQDYDRALEAFSNALASPGYATPYKALSGIGAVQLKLGNPQAAGSAYREAALDTANPSPGKALVNLGMCFMELDRPADALSTYQTALDCGLRPADVSKCRAGMGQALLSQGRVGEAVEAFEAAMANGTYELSAVAAHDMAMAVSLRDRFGSVLGLQEEEAPVADAAPEAPLQEQEPVVVEADVQDDELAAANDKDDSDDSSELGSTQLMEPVAAADATTPMEPVAADGPAEQDDWDPAGMPVIGAAAQEPPVADDDDATAADEQDDFSNAATQVFPVVAAAQTTNAPAMDDDLPVEAFKAMDADEEALIPSPEDTAFFTIKEEDVERAAKEERRKARKGHLGLKILLFVVIVIIALMGAAAAAYVYGYGYPLQEKVAQEFLDAAKADQSTDAYWSPNISQESRDSQMAVLEGVSSYEIIAVQRSTSNSTVYVKATLDAGGTTYYELTMGRDLIGWDVEYVELYFPSEQ